MKRDRATWSTAQEAVIVCCQRVVLRRTLRIALVVGTILSAVNQGGVLLGGQASGMTWLRVAANYVIPFCVSNAGVLSATRAPAGHQTLTDPPPDPRGEDGDP